MFYKNWTDATKNNLVKIDYYKKSLLALLIPTSYKISINDQNQRWNCSFSGTNIAIQGANALDDVLRQPEMANEELISPEEYKTPKLIELRNKYEKTWKSYLWSNKPFSEKRLKLERKNLEYLKWKYDVELQKEFIKLHHEIFPESPKINPPKLPVERFTDDDDD